MRQKDEKMEEDLQYLLRRLPDSFRYARSGRHVSIVTFKRKGRGDQEGVMMRIGTGGPGQTMTLSCKRFGGVERTKALAAALADACGMSHAGQYKGPVPGEPNSRNVSGAGNINFRWQEARTGWVLQVLAYVGTSTSGKGTRCWSTRRHGPELALENAVRVREEAGYVVDRSLLLERLHQVLAAGPARSTEQR